MVPITLLNNEFCCHCCWVPYFTSNSNWSNWYDSTLFYITPQSQIRSYNCELNGTKPSRMLWPLCSRTTKERWFYLAQEAGKHWEARSCWACHWQPCQHSVLVGRRVRCQSGRSPRGRCPSDCSPPDLWMSTYCTREDRERCWLTVTSPSLTCSPQRCPSFSLAGFVF